MLLALKLKKRIAGYAMQDNEIPARYKAAFDSLHCITNDRTVSPKMILAQEPVFLMFWNGSADYDYEFLSTNGSRTYTMTPDVKGAKIESVYEAFAFFSSAAVRFSFFLEGTKNLTAINRLLTITI